MLWAPLIDRFDVPWLGRRRGWIVFIQWMLGGALFLMGSVVAGVTRCRCLRLSRCALPRRCPQTSDGRRDSTPSSIKTEARASTKAGTGGLSGRARLSGQPPRWSGGYRSRLNGLSSGISSHHRYIGWMGGFAFGGGLLSPLLMPRLSWEGALQGSP